MMDVTKMDIEGLIQNESENLRAAIKKLPEKEMLAVVFRFYKGLSQEETAQILHSTRMEISRLERAGICHLRSYMTAEERNRV